MCTFACDGVSDAAADTATLRVSQMGTSTKQRNFYSLPVPDPSPRLTQAPARPSPRDITVKIEAENIIWNERSRLLFYITVT